MTIQNPLEMGPENDPPLITPDSTQVTEQTTPAPAGVSDSTDEQSAFTGEDTQVAGLMDAVTNRITRPIRTIWEIRGAGGANLPKALQLKVKRGEKLFTFRSAKKKDDYVDPDDLTAARARELADEYDAILLDSSTKEFDLDQSIHLNADNFAITGDFERAHQGLTEHYSKLIDEARRGVVSDEITEGLARALSDDPKFIREFLERHSGQAHSAAENLAAHKILEASARRLRETAIFMRRHATGDQLMVAQLEFLQQWNFHKSWLAQYMGARAEAGRSLRAFRGDQTLGADVPIRNQRMEEMLNHWGAGMNLEQMGDQIIAGDSLVGINGIVNAKNQGVSRWGAAVSENMIGSILSGFSTAAVNVFGNAMMVGRHIGNVSIASRLGRWTMGGNENQHQVGEAQAYLFGMLMSMKDAGRAALISMRTTEPYGGSAKFEGTRDKAISGKALKLGGVFGWIADVYGHIARAPMERILGPTDAFYKVIAERGMWAQLAYRQARQEQLELGLSGPEFSARLRDILDNPTEEGLLRAVEHGEYQTFTNPLGDFGRNMQKIINSNTVFKLLVPVYRTPANISKVGFMEDSPLGVAFPSQREKLFPTILPGNKSLTPLQIEDAEMARSRMMMGMGIITWMALTAWAGNLTGSGPSDRHQRNALRTGNWAPRSMVIGRDEHGNPTTFRSFDRMEPWSLTIGAVADFVDVIKVAQWMDLDQTQMDLINDTGAALTVAITENTLNKSYMRGVNEAMDALYEPERFWVRWSAGMVNAQMPLSGLRRDARKLEDSYMREAIGFVDRLKNSFPYFSDDLPIIADLHGDYVEWEHILNLPLKVYDTPGTRATAEYGRLYEETHEVAVTDVARKILGVKLDADLKHDFKQLSRKGFLVNAQLLAAEFSNDAIVLRDVDVLIPLYNATEDFRDRVKPVSREGFVNFAEAVEMLILSDVYNAPGTTDYARTIMLGQLQKGFDNMASQFMQQYNSQLKQAIELRKQNELRRMIGRDKADQVISDEGYTPIEPTGGKSPFDF